MSTISSANLELVKEPLRRLRGISYYGKSRFCPICSKSSRKFLPKGREQRKDATCPHCSGVERHRFVYLYMQQKTNLFDGRPKKVLHVAPLRCLQSTLTERLGDNYLTADLLRSRAMVEMDVTNIQYPDESFDAILCIHVFHQIEDDQKAMREVFRVLKNDGWAILLVPISVDKTIENPSIVDPSERLAAFGEVDHVRRYGPDYIARLRKAGFNVEVTKVSDLVLDDEALRMGLTAASGDIYYCTKP